MWLGEEKKISHVLSYQASERRLPPSPSSSQTSGVGQAIPISGTTATARRRPHHRRLHRCWVLCSIMTSRDQTVLDPRLAPSLPEPSYDTPRQHAPPQAPHPPSTFGATPRSDSLKPAADGGLYGQPYYYPSPQTQTPQHPSGAQNLGHSGQPSPENNGGAYQQVPPQDALSPGHGDEQGDDAKRPRACEACRGLKVRCDQDASHPEVPCRRCAKAGRQCVITQPTRKRQKKSDSRVAELE